MDTDAWQKIPWIEARRQPPPEVDFCLPNFLAGSVGVVAAQAGIGKTSLLLQIAAAVALGVPVAGGLLPPPRITGRVVFLATEDPLAVLQRRAHFLVRSLESQGHGADVAQHLEQQLQFYSVRSKLPNLLANGGIGERGLDRLTSLARDSRLLILDPIRRFHLCDEQDFGQMSLLFGLLADIAAQTGCSILFSHHLPQPLSTADQDDPAGALGSSAFINATRWVLNLTDMSRSEADRLGVAAEARRDHVRASFTKSNYGPPLAPRWLKRSGDFEGVFDTWEAE
ncbi:MAG TPA: AAA family ATPase [Rhodocyclaceae bacterium]